MGIFLEFSRKGKGYKVTIHLVTKEVDSLKQQLLEFEHLDPLVPWALR
jgi:hypothetical protein